MQHIGVNFTRIIKAFIIFKDQPGGPAAYFNQLSNFTNIFGSTIYVAQTLVGDAFVVRTPATAREETFHITRAPPSCTVQLSSGDVNGG